MLIKLELSELGIKPGDIPGITSDQINKYNQESQEYRDNLVSYITSAIQPDLKQLFIDYKNVMKSRIDVIRNQTRKEFNQNRRINVSERALNNIKAGLLNIKTGILEIDWDDIAPFISSSRIVSLWLDMIKTMVSIIIDISIETDLNVFRLQLDSWYNKLIEVRGMILQRIRTLTNIRLPRIAVQTLMNNIIVFWNIRDFVVPNVNLLDSAKKISDRFS